jgi:hypothetical protein
MAYEPKFAAGGPVRIVGLATLNEFLHSYKLHHPLQENQLAYAGRRAKVIRACMYHGADQLYELEGVPGIWHERLLEAVTPENSD